MAIRRLNFTGRKRISRSDVAISLDRNSVPPQFDAALALVSYGFPDDAEVVIEATADWTLMRFSVGTVARLSSFSGVLDQFETPEALHFAVKVLGVSDSAGLILGEASGITPSDPENERSAKSFVDVRPGSLGHVGWNVVFDATHPILVVNSLVGDWKGFVRTPTFRALVVPEVFRRMLEVAADEDIEFDGDAPGRTWEAQCLAIAARYSNQQLPVPRDPDPRTEWIDQAVSGFARHHRLGVVLRELVNDGGDQ